jgi:hypothetical protein
MPAGPPLALETTCYGVAIATADTLACGDVLGGPGFPSVARHVGLLDLEGLP